MKGTGFCYRCEKTIDANFPGNFKRHVVKTCNVEIPPPTSSRRSSRADSSDAMEANDSHQSMSRSPSPTQARSYVNVGKRNVYRIHSYFPKDIPIYKFDYISEDTHKFINGHEQRGISKDDVLGKLNLY